jgi:lipoprotein-releasing system permease protein
VRLRVLLLLLAPLWGPPALLVGLCRICGDGLLFVLESYVDRPLDPPRALRWPLYIAALALFPLVVALETAASSLLHLASLVELGPGRPLLLRVPAGLLLALLFPIWAPLLALGWALRRLVWDLGVTRAVDRVSGRQVRSPSRGRFETFVALRYMRGRKAQAGVSVVTGLTVFGVTLGVWTLVVVLSVMAGFESDLQQKILGANAHVVVLSYTGEIEDWPAVADRVRATEAAEITGITPFIYSEYMLRSRHTVIGAVFKGIDPATVGQVTDLVDNLVLGPDGRIRERSAAQGLLERMDRLHEGPLADGAEAPPELPGLLIGQEMAATLRVAVGDVVQAVSPLSEPGPLGTPQARIVEFRVAGIFHSGMYEYDTKFSYASLDGARRFMRLDEVVTGLEIKVRDIYDAPRIAGHLGAVLQYPHWTRDWQKMNEPLFAALKLEKVVMGIILTFIVAVASMNIISTLIMLVIEKRREIAIMKAMGAGRSDLMKLFVVDGLLVGFIGTVIGLFLGLLTCWALERWQFIKLESDVYYVDTLPVDVSAGLVAVVAVIAVLISFLATLYPSWEGSSVDPVEGLRDA